MRRPTCGWLCVAVLLALPAVLPVWFRLWNDFGAPTPERLAPTEEAASCCCEIFRRWAWLPVVFGMRFLCGTKPTCCPSWIWSMSIGCWCSCRNGANSGPEGCAMSPPPSVTPPSNCYCICSKLTNSRWANCPWPEVEPLRLWAFCFRGLMLLLLWNCWAAPVVLAVVETPPPAPTMFAKLLRLAERCCCVNLSDRFLFWIFYSPLCKLAIT